jgi:hypothetical protein
VKRHRHYQKSKIKKHSLLLPTQATTTTTTTTTTHLKTNLLPNQDPEKHHYNESIPQPTKSKLNFKIF